MTVPRATYRVQLGRDFGFAAAAGIVEYLDALGVSHLYTSPFFQARKGSTHGYDITDHGRVHDELGGRPGLDALSGALRRRSMGMVIDIVPNHMGIGLADNAWWLDVLRWGRRSRYADYFDIDWRPIARELRDRVLAPFLGDHYGRVLERGELTLSFDGEAGKFSVEYHDHRFPIAPPTYPALFPAGAAAVPLLDHLLARFRELASGGDGAALEERAAGLEAELAQLVAGDTSAAALVAAAVEAHRGTERAALTRLDALLEAQAYRVAFWRVAAEEINYRRFFDINALAGLRVERDELFDRVHALVLDLCAAGVCDGLRVDHIDGLHDPERYCRRLREAVERVGARPYLVVEKILAEHEHLRASWGVDGTTGYEFTAEVGALLVDAAAEDRFDRLYRRQAPGARPFTEMLRDAKHEVMARALTGELHVLVRLLERIAERSWRTRDFTFGTLQSALEEVVACFPTYRSYVTDAGAAAEDRRDIDWAVGQARKAQREIDASVFDFIHAVMTLDLECSLSSGYDRSEVLAFTMKLQQLTGPVMAKAMEDTTFYRYLRLLALNEVGSDPRRFGSTAAAFHQRQAQRAKSWRHSLLATSTHDTKRGEDARARIAALSELPAELAAELARWHRLNRSRRETVGDAPAPTAAHLYLLYQALLGSWPAEAVGDAGRLGDFPERMVAYLQKAMREGKEVTSWTRPDEAYEAAVASFVRRILDTARPNPFLERFVPFQAVVAKHGMVGSLAQTVLKLTVPGVPDIYQGAELWDLSLVDPDNRRPVDHASHAALLRDLEPSLARPSVASAAELLASWPDARIKLYLVAQLLRLRRDRPALFAEGDYQPLAATGRFERHVVAFRRQHEGGTLVVVVARLGRALAGDDSGAFAVGARWGDTSLAQPEGGLAERLTDVLTGRRVDSLQIGALFEALPVAVLVTPAVV
jgi:(1->4)-alpha-D-glucan 1-alpha-D-glucosylmutase